MITKRPTNPRRYAASFLQTRRAYETLFGCQMPGDMPFQTAASVICAELGIGEAARFIQGMSNDPSAEFERRHYAMVISNRYGPEADEDRGWMTLEQAKERAADIVDGQDPAWGAWANQVNIYPVDADGEVNYGVDPIASRYRRE